MPLATKISNVAAMTSDTIEIRGLRAMGCHGVLDFEKVRPQPFVVDLVLIAELRKAGQTDALDDTVSYSVIVNAVVAVIEGEHCDLIEHLAERIASAVLQYSRITSADVTVRKPRAPVAVDVTDVGVRIHRP